MVDYAAWFDVDDLSVEQVAHLWAEGRADIAAMRLQILQSAIAAGKLRVDGRTSLIWRGDLKEFADARGERPVFLFGYSPVATSMDVAPNQTVVGQLKSIIASGSPMMEESERHMRNRMARLKEAIERAEAREADRRAEMRPPAPDAHHPDSDTQIAIISAELLDRKERGALHDATAMRVWTKSRFPWLSKNDVRELLKRVPASLRARRGAPRGARKSKNSGPV